MLKRLLAGCLSVLFVAAAAAQEYPTRTISIVVPFAPGGPTDTVTRLVGQAMGILMERFDMDADRAFAVLKRYSQDTNTKLRDVAQQLIDTRKLP